MSIPEQIFSSLIRDLYDVPIMSNLTRPHYVEHMVTIGLGEGFKLTSADWVGWDIEGPDNIRIEVKQSAARQTWAGSTSQPSSPTKGAFDIAPRTGYFTDGGATWVQEPGRYAELYILCWHPVAEESEVDHRDPEQWLFFVVPTEQLPPDQKTISRTVVEKKWSAVSFEQLRSSVLENIGRRRKIGEK